MADGQTEQTKSAGAADVAAVRYALRTLAAIKDGGAYVSASVEYNRATKAIIAAAPALLARVEELQSEKAALQTSVAELQDALIVARVGVNGSK